jgi:hypothetical protein
MNKKDPHPLDAAILQKAAQPGGFSINDARGQPAKNAQKRCTRMVASGKLFRAEITRIFIRYFTTSAAAVEFQREELAKKAKTSIEFSQRQAPAKTAKKHVEVILPAGLKIQILPSHKYEPLNLAQVLRDCVVGSARRTCHVRSDSEVA